MIIKGKNLAYNLEGKLYHCAMDITMDYIGGKWKSVVLWYLKNGTHRFTELKRQIPDITEKMLSIQLRALEADGLINRKVHGIKPPIRAEYSLTEFGKTLIPTLDAIAKWGRNLGETEGKLVAFV
jgi:DNA-binding HxlR family transcriptional regulator